MSGHDPGTSRAALPSWLPLMVALDAIATVLVVYDLAANDGPGWLTWIGAGIFALGGLGVAVGISAVKDRTRSTTTRPGDDEPPQSPIEFH